MSSAPSIIRPVRLPIRSTRLPANGARHIEAKMMIDDVPGAVENMWNRFAKAAAKKPPPPPAVSGRPHFSWKKSVESAVNGKIAE